MADVKIRVFKHGESKPDTTVTIPGSVLNVASKRIPKKAVAALQEEEIDLDELIKLSKNFGCTRDSCRDRGTQKE